MTKIIIVQIIIFSLASVVQREDGATLCTGKINRELSPRRRQQQEGDYICILNKLPLPRKKMTQARAAHLTRAIFILIHSFGFLYETVGSLGRQRFFKPREGNTREHFAYQDSSFFPIFKPTNSTSEKILNVNVVVWKHDKQKNGSLSGCHPWPKSVACLELPSDAKRPHLKSCRGRQNTTLRVNLHANWVLRLEVLTLYSERLKTILLGHK